MTTSSMAVQTSNDAIKLGIAESKTNHQFITEDKNDFNKFDYLTTIDIFDIGYDYIGLVSCDKFCDKFIYYTQDPSLKQKQSHQLKYPQLQQRSFLW